MRCRSIDLRLDREHAKAIRDAAAGAARPAKPPPEREALLRAIVETSPDGLITIDEQGCHRNPSIRPPSGLFGYAADEIVGQNVKMLMPAPYREEHDGYIARYLATGEKRIIGIGREVLGQRKDGTQLPARARRRRGPRRGERRIFAGLRRAT